MDNPLYLDFKVLKEHEDQLARIGKLQTRRRAVFTPLTWYGLSIVEGFKFQAEVFERNHVRGFISNVYDLKYQDKKNVRHDLINHLSEKLGIPFKCDSGGFQNQIQNTGLTVEEVFEVQRRTNCDIAVQLDHPIHPLQSEREQRSRIRKTAENLERTIELNEKLDKKERLSILPTIHGYDEKTLNLSIQLVRDILGGKDPTAVSIGSMVPLNKTSKGCDLVQGKTAIIKAILHVRSELPNTFIHLLGVGGTMAYLGVLCGADSFDFAGWVQKAAYGVIQLPGVSDRFIQQRVRRKALTMQEKFKFFECTCHACKFNFENPVSMLDFDSDIDRASARRLRSLHNVHVFETEMYVMARFIYEGIIELFVRDRLKSSVLRKYINDFKETYKNYRVSEENNQKYLVCTLESFL
ncbi:MAG: tRNA-guanine transglycosylase [Candidatus Sigynarchaeota archaeon]